MKLREQTLPDLYNLLDKVVKFIFYLYYILGEEVIGIVNIFLVHVLLRFSLILFKQCFLGVGKVLSFRGGGQK